MSKHLSVSENELSAKRLRAIAQIADMGKLGELDRAIQALIEGVSQGQSSLDKKIVQEFGSVGFTQAALDGEIVLMDEYEPPQVLVRHPNGGGWVPRDQSEEDKSMPFVAPTVYVGPFARVDGKARLTGNVKLHGRAYVSQHAQLSGEVELRHSSAAYGNTCFSGNVVMEGSSHAYGNACLSGNVKVCDNGQISGDACLSGNVIIEDSVEIGGHVYLTGDVHLRGNVCLKGCERIDARKP